MAFTALFWGSLYTNHCSWVFKNWGEGQKLCEPGEVALLLGRQNCLPPHSPPAH